MPDIDYARVRKVCALLASESDGEVLAAVRRLVAIAKAHKLTVDEMLFHPRASAPEPTKDPRTWKTEPTHNWGRDPAAAFSEEMFDKFADFIRRQAAQPPPHAQRPHDSRSAQEKRARFKTINWARVLREIRELAVRGLATFEQIAIAELAREQLNYHVEQGGHPASWSPAAMDAAQIIALAQKLGIVVEDRTGA